MKWLLLLSLLTLLIVVTLIIFRFTRPLKEEEIIGLAEKRREQMIGNYFTFRRGETSVDKEFKWDLAPDGRFYEVDLRLTEFPSYAASLLKHKKHEWVIIAFEKDRKIGQFWMNKGPGRTMVTSPVEFIARIAGSKKNEFTSILIFHNHPNFTRASDQDIKTATNRASEFNVRDINLVEFVCGRGEFFQYHLSPSDEFMPLQRFVEELNEMNGKSRMENLRLNLEWLS